MFDYEFDTCNIDWQTVCDEAISQAVLAFVYDSTNNIDDIPESAYKLLKQYTISVILKNEKVFQGQKELVKLLEENKIDYAVIKGLTAAMNYTKPELRTSGDVDFLVRKADFQRVKNLLAKNDYELIREEENHFHCALKKHGVLFEMHFEMSEFPNTELGEDLRDFLDCALDDVVECEYQGEKFKGLSTKYQMFSLLLHMERHMSKDGLGLRQLLDFGFFVKKYPQVMKSEEYVYLLKKYGLFKMASVCIDLTDKYFFDKEIENPTADMLIEMSLKRGNFGVKRDLEETYYNGMVRMNQENSVKKWFYFFSNRAELTWPLAKKCRFFRHFGIVYLPLRHFLRMVFRKKNRINYKKVFDSTKETSILYNNLSIFKG